MGLNRLDNFLKSTKGEILYVDPSSLDSTDSIDNRGNSLAQPFKTIQRALIEAARFSYQRGLDNDRFGKTTILLYPGEHLVDNRPGWIPIHEAPVGGNNWRLRSGTYSNSFSPFEINSNFNLLNPNNALYKLNSIYGGVIVPRGTSIVGLDLRKTKIRPRYVPNPENADIETSAVFRVTGACYLWQLTVLDGDPNGFVFKDYTTNVFVPNFSHHKLTCFEYADGVNAVNINDEFMTYSTNRTDLDMYYEKIGLAFGSSSGRGIEPEYPSSSLDIQPVVDEYQIVGPTGAQTGISSIRAGDGTISSNVVTVDIIQEIPNLNANTAIQIEGISEAGYDGQYVVSEVLSPTQFQYQVSNPPENPLPNVGGATVSLTVDTVTSASPYIFNCSLRSVYGMCGMHADGDKATGFKSMVVAQFTGIGLQKDDNAFVKYNISSGLYEDKNGFGNENIHTNSRAIYKPSYENYHIKCSNNSFLQIVSVFAIGFANHFVSDTGGDQSITNSNSNFGAKSLVASGFKKEAFPRDDVGYLTHVISPKELGNDPASIEFSSIDVGVTTAISAGAATTNRLYLYNEKNIDIPPSNVIDGYRIGAKENDRLNVLISQGNTFQTYSARIIMPNTQYTGQEISAEKIASVVRIGIVNSVSNNTLTLEQPHKFINGESVRVLSENGSLPDGLFSNQIYYAIVDAIAPNPSLLTNQIKLAKTLNDALNDTPIEINNKGGKLTIVSRVSDKNAGDIGHPIQFDQTNTQWYINVATASTENTIYSTINTLGISSLGQATSRTFFERNGDTRNTVDSLYRFRYVIPKDSPITSRPPVEGFVIQESNNTSGITTSEVERYLNPGSVSLNNSAEFRNFRFIANTTWNPLDQKSTIITETPHRLTEGSIIQMINVKSFNNVDGDLNKGYNKEFVVEEVIDRRTFKISISPDPGIFLNNVSTRDVFLPRIVRKKSSETYVVYKAELVQEYIQNKQDGIYHLLVVNSSNSPTIEPFTEFKLSQPLSNLYPQIDRDNLDSDPEPATSFAVSDPIGKVVVDDPKKSITKETLVKTLNDFSVGIAITNIVSDVSGTTHTVYTKNDHGLNRIVELFIENPGLNYGSGIGVTETYYNAILQSEGTTITGYGANAIVTINPTGQIQQIKLIDGGSAYSVGNKLKVVGIATTTNHVVGILSVTRIYSNVNDVVSINGIRANSKGYNTLYRISQVSNGQNKQLQLISANQVSGASTTGISSNITSNSSLYVSGKSFTISGALYNPLTGITTISLTENHGLRVNEKVIISGATNSSEIYNGTYLVNETPSNSLNSFIINVGAGRSTSSPTISGTAIVYPDPFTSKGGNIVQGTESLSPRLTYEYDNLTTTLSFPINDITTNTVTVANQFALDLQIGDYLLVDNEIMRISSTVTGNPISVFRGLLGTKKSTHKNGTVVRRIKIIPIEFRRHSIIRASGHTFEYLGYGPGNYSTAFPDKHDRQLSKDEELLSQSFSLEGGFPLYTGMNSDGDSYVGNKKTNGTTGEEEVFNTPIQTFTGEDILSNSRVGGVSVINSQEATFSRSIKVEGGDDSNIISEFNSPVVFNNKITSTSEKGVEATSLFLQGNERISRKYTVGITSPANIVLLTSATAGNPGDVIFNGNPVKGQNVGWIYTTNNTWNPFGAISSREDAMEFNGTFVGNFVGDGTGLFNVTDIWGIDATGIHTTRNVGFATTSSKPNIAMYCAGNAEIVGSMRVFEIIEKTTIINTVGILSSIVPVNIDLDSASIYYYTSNATGNWTINFRANAGLALTSFMLLGDSITAAISTRQGSTPYYNNIVKIDGITMTPRYYGSLPITSGNANSIDLYTYVIIRKNVTGSPTTDFDILYSQSQYQ